MMVLITKNMQTNDVHQRFCLELDKSGRPSRHYFLDYPRPLEQQSNL